MQWKPNVTVAAVAEKDGRFLLVEEEADNAIVFNQPAGHLEKNESFITAIKREVLEETAWNFEPESLVGVYLYPSPRVDVVYLRFCFYGKCINRHPGKPLDEGILRTVWMSREEIAAISDKLRSPMVLHCIDDHLAGRHYPLQLLHDFITG